MNGDHFRDRLKELREQAGLSQKDLADRIGQTIRQVSRLETGNQRPSWDTVLALAAALGVSCQAFMEAPAERPPAAKGRPSKAPASAPEKPKRPRGRPGRKS